MLNYQENFMILRLNMNLEMKENIKNCIITTCFISYVDPAKRGPEQYTHLATGKARRNIIDPPNRGVGRRKALGDALKRSRFFNKSERVKLWEWYFQNHSDKVQTIKHLRIGERNASKDLARV